MTRPASTPARRDRPWIPDPFPPERSPGISPPGRTHAGSRSSAGTAAVRRFRTVLHVLEAGIQGSSKARGPDGRGTYAHFLSLRSSTTNPSSRANFVCTGSAPARHHQNSRGVTIDRTARLSGGSSCSSFPSASPTAPAHPVRLWPRPPIWNAPRASRRSCARGRRPWSGSLPGWPRRCGSCVRPRRA